MDKSKIKFIKFLICIIVILLLGYLINKCSIFNSTSPKVIKEYISSFGLLSPIVFIILFTVIPLTLFPDSVLAVAGGLAFGVIKGTIYTLIGAVAGATLSFFISRVLGRNFVKKIIKDKKIYSGIKLGKNGFITILILRLVPLIPFDIISYSAGLSNIKYKDFILATAIGIIPGILVYTNLGDKTNDIGSNGFFISIVLLILLLGMSFFLKNIVSIKKIQCKLKHNKE